MSTDWTVSSQTELSLRNHNYADLFLLLIRKTKDYRLPESSPNILIITHHFGQLGDGTNYGRPNAVYLYYDN